MNERQKNTIIGFNNKEIWKVEKRAYSFTGLGRFHLLSRAVIPNWGAGLGAA